MHECGPLTVENLLNSTGNSKVKNSDVKKIREEHANIYANNDIHETKVKQSEIDINYKFVDKVIQSRKNSQDDNLYPPKN
ncbi:hypothetical protein [Candidatus Bandiella euplotis]|uniref:Uncharacterized protein n=1 Tax=Candidatus Bandiella euplotis TaxID=1664265 RepID=A0ABZ0UKM9_9RICK|nr:hypothetical protein [Candidatus Bandiella woodruffii]WPX96163.1 hypothetical protein Bandiella_00272 [Candidatus Bandiella woodruffii]WPX96685.1 hypothetical protein Bandiella_00805 [Candidatus Bandiella woodruffii]